MWLASSLLVQGRDAVRSQQQSAAPFAFMKRGEFLYKLRNSWLSRITLLRLVGFKPFCIVSFHFIRDDLTLDPRCLVKQSMRAKTFCLKQAVKLSCCAKVCPSQSQWPHGLGCRSTVARLLGLRVRIP
jgi:hypothetical protein